MHRPSIVRDTIQSLGFLSRLPLPSRWFEGSGDSLKESVRAFPLAGAILGTLAGVALFICDYLGLPALACSFVSVGALIAMTGALHEDGLGDTADGFFGASTPARRLEIMKDSRIGTFAALTLIIFIGLKVTILAAILQRFGAFHTVLVIIGTEAASRAAMLALWYQLPSARPGGVADNVGAPKWETLLCAMATGVGILIATIFLVVGISALLKAMIFAFALLYGFAKLCLVKIGGQTGDTLGAAQQLVAIGILLGVASSL